MDLTAHYQQLYKQVRSEYACDASTPGQVGQWQAAFRPRLKEALGLARMEKELAGYGPRAEQISSTVCESFAREEWLLWTEPTVALPFYLLRPAAASNAKLPLVLTPHGHNHPHIYAGIYHSEDERKTMVEGDRDIAVQAVREGYLVISPTTRGFGETRTADDKVANKLSSCRTALMHGLLVGRTPIGERVWDISRLIDFALADLPVDQERIVITGNSGGGTVSLFAAACEERISVAVPSCYFCTFRGSIGSIFHCDCNYVPGLLTLGEMYDVAGLIAPRPLLVIAGREDKIFPLPEVKIAFERLQAIYRAAGAGARAALFVGEGGHRYYKSAAWPFVRQALGEAVAAA